MTVPFRPVDAFLLLSFGGPEAKADVMPFLENVTRGRDIPAERLEEVAEHYYSFGGVSPINQQCRDLLAAVVPELRARGINVPIYWGNRNWDPMLEETMAMMADDGIRHAITFVTSAYSSYSGCRQYREDIARAQEAVTDAPMITKLRQFYDHPGFIEPFVEATQPAVDRVRNEVGDDLRIVFTAHSIPSSMGETSKYQQQLEIASQLVMDRLDTSAEWDLVFQSRSGDPQQTWLDPDICDHIETLHGKGVRGVVLVPIGFVSDHLEVVYDLDTEAKQKAEELSMAFARVATPGTHPKFVSMVCDLVEEHMRGTKPQRLAPPIEDHTPCAENCCPSPSMLRAAKANS